MRKLRLLAARIIRSDVATNNDKLELIAAMIDLRADEVMSLCAIIARTNEGGDG